MGGRFCNLPPPTYGGVESAFLGVSGTSKAGETSTDVNRCQHISTHVNTPQGGRGDPPYMGFAFLFERGGEAGLQGWDGGKPLKDGFSPYNCAI